MVPAEENDIKIRLVVTDIGFGTLGGWLAVKWMVLNEAGHVLQLGCGAVRSHAFEVLDLWRLRNAGNRHRNSGAADLGPGNSEQHRLRQGPSPLSEQEILPAAMMLIRSGVFDALGIERLAPINTINDDRLVTTCVFL